MQAKKENIIMAYKEYCKHPWKGYKKYILNIRKMSDEKIKQIFSPVPHKKIRRLFVEYDYDELHEIIEQKFGIKHLNEITGGMYQNLIQMIQRRSQHISYKQKYLINKLTEELGITEQGMQKLIKKELGKETVVQFLSKKEAHSVITCLLSIKRYNERRDNGKNRKNGNANRKDKRDSEETKEK